MDYVMRDSYHSGVAYRKFDYHRVIDTIRILRIPDHDKNPESNLCEYALGVEDGGLHAIESLLLARYAMYSQVYFHPIRRVYDLHLVDFLRSWLPNQVFSTDIEEHLRYTDNEINVAIHEALHNRHSSCHDPARRILSRDHLKLIYSANLVDRNLSTDPGQRIFRALRSEFREHVFKRDSYRERHSPSGFPVRMSDGRILSSVGVSEILERLPLVAVDFVYTESCILEEATMWLRSRRSQILSGETRDADDG